MSKEEYKRLYETTHMRYADIADGMDAGVIKGYRIYELNNAHMVEITGLMLEVYVNKSLHYYEEMLKSWKNRLNAETFYVSFRQKYISLCFTIREL